MTMPVPPAPTPENWKSLSMLARCLVAAAVARRESEPSQ